MFDPMLTMRLAHIASDMSWRTASACAELTRSNVSLWASLVEGSLNGFSRSPRHGRSWYRAPEPAPQSSWPFPGFMPWAGMGTLNAATAPALAWSSSWQAPWLRLWQPPLALTAWPMALALMSAGLPRTVAWPAAEAGAHMMEASRKAAEGLEQMFSAYRSDGGHATAQIILSHRLL